jgi:sec-independent protein translocase protein TatC
MFVGLITPDAMKWFREFTILCFFILSAILTPPDVATQIMMALPIMVLYELSIFLSRGDIS